MNCIYNLSISLYSTVARLVALRSKKVKTMLQGQKSAFDYLRKVIDPEASYVWVHAASLGEFEQGRPLIEMLRRENPDKKILLTFFSPSGYEVRKDYKGVDAVCYLPFDKPCNARRLLDIVKVEAAVFVKYEFWGNYLEEIHRRNIPLYLISSIFRPSQSFFKWWGGTFRKILSFYTHIFVQDEQSRKLLAGIGVENVTVAGDTRFDRVTDIMRTVVKLPLIDWFKYKNPKTIVFGSSWEADEDVYIPWFNEQHGVKAIIAPHEFNTERLARLKARIPGSMLWSEFQELHRTPNDGSCGAVNPDLTKCIIIDCFGLLSSLYRYGDIAYVGGGFGAGIHNINEAAVYGMPVIFGPKFSKFKEAGDLIERGGAFTVSGESDFRAVIDSLIEDASALERASKVAGDYIQDNLGATKRIYDKVFR